MANALERYPTTHSSQTQFQIGIDTKAKALISLKLTNTSEYTSEVGQTLLPEFKSDGFEVTLGIQKGSPRRTQVTDLVEFFVLVQLNDERLPMKLKVEAKGTFKAFLLNSAVQVPP